MGYIAAVRRKLGTAGVRKTVVLGSRRAYDALFHGRLLFFRVDLDGYATDMESVDREDRVLPRKSIDEITSVERKAFKEYGGASLIRLWNERFQKGHRLFVTYHGSEVAGASWVYEGGTERFFTVPLAEGEVFIVAVFVLENFRGRGLGTRTLALILQMMKDEGFQRAFICTKEWNHFQKAIRRAGFQCVGKLREIKVFRKSIQIWSDSGASDFP
jgi:GNAT superfamily N-acetyltransferase